MLKLNHKILVWKRGIELISQIYSITENFKKKCLDYVIKWRRASISIASNIAEGDSRKSCLEREKIL
ncbi:MAG: four helix bundle protein [Ignavibacteria bacterium]|nr:four helix bundle protein [Ignavibacteria bacterium]